MTIKPNLPGDDRHDAPTRTRRKTLGRSTRLLTTAGLTAALLAGGLGGRALAADRSDGVVPTIRSVRVTDRQLGDLTLDELAAEMAELDLVVRVEPASGSAIVDEAIDESTDEWEADDLEAPEVDELDPDLDPFAGMTDDEIDALSDEEFFAILEAAGFGDEPGFGDSGEADGDWSGDWSDADDGWLDDDVVLGAFAVDGDSIDVSLASSPDVAEQAQAIWQRFARLIPADQRAMVTSFELNPAEEGGAYVYPDDNDPTKWVLGVSLGLGEDLDYVLIHEFGHLLTLQAEEVPPAADADPDACPTYFTGEGCALSGTTMAAFVEQFWPRAQLEEIERLNQRDDFDGLDAFYAEHADDFVTDYATMNPAEDLAETFAHFVIEDRPSGSTIADQKVNMLWDDPALVTLRSQIRSNR